MPEPDDEAPNPGDPRWVVRVLGPLEVRTGTGLVRPGPPQQRLVLGLLIASAGRPMATERLISDVWPDDPPPQARKTIQVYVSNLRRQLGGADGVLRTAPNGYVLAADRVEIDAVEFERATAAADESPDAAPAAAASRARRALDLWVGTPYADVGDALPIRAERVRLIELRLGALERRIEADLALGRHRELIGELEALTIEHPYRERFIAQLMLAQYRAGRQADALRTMRRARRILDEELGIEPGAELRTLEHRILTQDGALDLSAVATSAGGPDATTAAGHDGVHAIRGYELRDTLDATDDIAVHRAYQASVGREVQVTVIGPTWCNTAAFVQRFERIAQRVAQLAHPHIVTLHDHWRDPDGAYLVQPWLRGGRLADTLERRTLSTSAAVQIVTQVGAAVGYAHRNGVVHGRLTSQAVLLDDEGNAYLGDFALAAVPDGEASAAAASPAAARDVRALARLLHEVVVGRAPDAGGDVTDDARLPPELRAVVAPLLDGRAEPQLRSADELVRALRQAAGLDSVGVARARSRPFADVRNPYKGLRAFGRPDAQDFHGREELVARLVDATAAHRLVAVVGPSGSGKSSVVRAGLLAELDDRLVLPTEMFPGAYPFEELETALLRVAVDRPKGMIADLTADDRGLLRVVKQIVPDERHEILLVIDQFEELFSLVPDVETQQALMGALTTALSDPRSQLRVVLTLRADFFDRPLEHASFGELVRRGLVPVTVPTRDELARAVSQPAADVGLDLEPGLTAEIVADVDDQPGGLPLLQYALTELFRARTSNRLTGVDYRRIGGVTGALGTRAEGLYVDLGPDRQEAVRQVFLRLVTAGNGADDVRRRVRLSELSALALEPGALDVVLERFGSHRLLSFDRDPVTRGPTVEVAHEALLREWGRLHDWVESRRADLIVHRRFAAAVGEWEQAARDPSFLAQGGRLEQFETGTADSELTLTEPERAFLDASRERRAAEQRAAEERARRQVRTNRRLRRLLAGIGVLSVLVAIAGGVAVLQARRAGTAAVAADARRVGAQALAAGDMDRALLLAVEGVRLDDTPGARADLLTTLGRNPALRRVLRRDPDRAYGAVNVSADGRTGAVHDDTGRLRFFDTRSGDVRATYETGGVERASSGLVTGRALFHPDGGPIAVGTSTPGPQPVRLLDPDTFAELPDNLGGFAPQNMRPWGMAYSPDGSRLAVAFDRYVATSRPRPTADDAVVVLWDLVTPTEPIAILTDVPRHTHDVAFSPDGRQLYTAAHAAPPVFDTDAMIVVHDIATEAVVRTLDVPSHPFALHPDGTVLAAASRAPETVDPSTGTDVVLIDAVSGEQLHRLRGHTGPVTDLAFSPDGALVASSAADHTVAMWDVSTGDRVERLEGHTGPVSSVVFGPGDGAALSASVDGAVLAWDRAGDRGFMTARTIAGDLLEPGGGLFLEDFSAVSPSGGSILTIATVRDVQERGQRDLFVGRVGRTQAQLVDVASGRAGRVVDTGHGAFATAAWHPDGQEFVTVGEDGSVKVWDAATMSVIVERQMPNGMIGATYVDDGGQLLAVGLNGVPIQRLDAATLEPRSEPFAFLTGLTAFPYAAPDSDVGAIVTGDDTGVVAGDQRALDGRLLLVDTANGEIQHDLPMAFAARHAAMSPDGSVVAVAGDSGQVGVVDVADGRLVRPPTPAHLRAVVSVDYSPDGATVASGGRDGRVALWDGRTGDLRGTVQVTSAGTRVFVGFAPDGNTVTAATQDGRIHTIDVRPDRWVEHACAVAGRNLTRTEWRDAFGDRPYRETCERL